MCKSFACWEAVICEYKSVHFVPCVSVDCGFAEKWVILLLLSQVIFKKRDDNKGFSMVEIILHSEVMYGDLFLYHAYIMHVM